MTNRKLEGMRRQRGAALILVLLALALGSLLITPTLNYVYTGLIETRVSEKLLLQQYAADAGVEYSLWQLKYDLTDPLDLENPSANTTITVNDMEVPVITEISQSPHADNGTFPVLPSESGIHLAVALEIIPPFRSEPGEIAYFTHLVYIYNYGTSAAHLKALFQQLDPDLMYVPESYEGPTAELAESYVDDHWELHWDFSEPLPKLEEQETMLISFITSTLAGEDIGEHTYLSSGWVSYAGFEEEVVEYSGESGLTSFGLYDITVTIGSYTLLVSVGITEEGEIVIRSWQLQ